MKLISIFFVAFLGFNNSYACRGPMSEKAQDHDASVKFIGKATSYKIKEPKKLAMVTFEVSDTLRGESKKSWNLFFRSISPPKNLKMFQKKFGNSSEVGIRQMIAPGEKSNSKKLAFYIVDNACSMNGENWLLKSLESPHCGGRKTTWYNCRKDSDCTVSYNECVHKAALNLKFSSEVSAFNKCMGPIVDCVSPKYDRNKNKTKSVCKNNKCMIAK